MLRPLVLVLLTVLLIVLLQHALVVLSADLLSPLLPVQLVLILVWAPLIVRLLVLLLVRIEGPPRRSCRVGARGEIALETVDAVAVFCNEVRHRVLCPAAYMSATHASAYNKQLDAK